MQDLLHQLLIQPLQGPVNLAGRLHVTRRRRVGGARERGFGCSLPLSARSALKPPTLLPLMGTPLPTPHPTPSYSPDPHTTAQTGPCATQERPSLAESRRGWGLTRNSVRGAGESHTMSSTFLYLAATRSRNIEPLTRSPVHRISVGQCSGECMQVLHAHVRGTPCC